MITCSTAEIHGHYDFFTNLITLDKFTARELPLVNLALNNSVPPLNTPEAIELRNIRGIVKHEITHFLDHTTSIWGLEFLFRRDRFVQHLGQARTDVIERLEVYLLNAAELQMHSDLVKIHDDVSFDQCDTVRHELVYKKEYGPIVIIKFFRNDELISDVPLSMLSLLEANAIANEYLARFDDLFHMEGETKVIAEAAVERKLQKILNEPDLAEYSLLIRLAKMHFAFLDTRQLLAYVSVLMNYCLNTSMLSLGTISECIRHSFANTHVGNGIWADLCRGMSRHVIAFKTILFMHSWISSASPKKKETLTEIMKTTPCQAIEMFWGEHGKSNTRVTAFERAASLEHLKTSGFNESFSVASQAIEKNLKWCQQRNLRNCQFEEIACLDILLGDDSVVSCPQRIDFDVVGHSYDVLDTYNEYDRLIGDNIEKFHMPLMQASAMLETILTQKESGQLRARQRNGTK